MVNALQRFDAPCLSIASGVLQKRAELHIQDCNNVHKASETYAVTGDDGQGGGLAVQGHLALQGELQVHNCHANEGGGLYVGGPWDVFLIARRKRGNLNIRGSVNTTRCSALAGGGQSRG